MKKNFNWKKFFNDLDIAMAMAIADDKFFGRQFLPSKDRFWDFLEFVHYKAAKETK